MPLSRPFSRWALTILSTSIVVAGFGLTTAAGPGDFQDMPQVLDVSRDGEVFVAFRTDTSSGAARRYGPQGEPYSHWVARDPFIGIAADVAGGLVMGSEAWEGVDHIDLYTPSGTRLSGWDQPDLLPNMAAAPVGDSLLLEVTYLTGDETRQAVRARLGGAVLDAWPVHATARDVAVGPYANTIDGVVVVSDGTTLDAGHVVRYRTNGTRIDDFALDGEDHGLDIDAQGRLWAAVIPELAMQGSVFRYSQSGQGEKVCDIDGRPVDMTLGLDGEIWMIAEPQEGPMFRALRRYSATCELIDEWSPEELVRPTQHASPTAGVTGTGPAPTLSATPASATPTSATPTSATPTAVTPTSATPTADTPTPATPTATPTSATPTASPPRRTFLPALTVVDAP